VSLDFPPSAADSLALEGWASLSALPVAFCITLRIWACRGREITRHDPHARQTVVKPWRQNPTDPPRTNHPGRFCERAQLRIGSRDVGAGDQVGGVLGRL
jgi:hypothetical protein